MFELLLRTPQALVEAVSDALVDELGALSVSVEDADAGTDAEQALFGEPGMPPPQPGWERSTLRALFADASAAEAAGTLLRAEAGEAGLTLHGVAPVPEQDWVRLTQSQFTPVEVTPEFWIVPSWHQPPAAAQRVIRLDPGLAFGTGTHPTTRMCLRWIARQAEDRVAEAATDPAAQHPARPPGGWSRVLDYGCGSGILAIGAALHGAREIDAVDIDPAAVSATHTNARDNGVALNAGPPELAHGLYPLVLANILATPLKLLAPLLAAHVAPGGQLVLAGILARQTDELRAAYAPWLALSAQDQEDGWVLLVGTRVAS